MRELAEQLGVREPQYSRLVDLLDLLCVEGLVARRGQRFTVKNRGEAQQEQWTGILTVNPRGFGFVASAGRPDVYVPANGIGGAMHGDTVQVAVLNKTSRGVEGQVVAVESRRNPRVAGTLRRRRNNL